MFESNSCTSDPFQFVKRSGRKELYYKMWIFQRPSISGRGWKAVLHLNWPEVEGTVQP